MFISRKVEFIIKRSTFIKKEHFYRKNIVIRGKVDLSPINDRYL
jgi:hypothetical protein